MSDIVVGQKVLVPVQHVAVEVTDKYVTVIDSTGKKQMIAKNNITPLETEGKPVMAKKSWLTGRYSIS